MKVKKKKIIRIKAAAKPSKKVLIIKKKIKSVVKKPKKVIQKKAAKKIKPQKLVKKVIKKKLAPKRINSKKTPKKSAKNLKRKAVLKTVAKNKPKKTRKPEASVIEAPFLAKLFFKAKIKVIGIGGGGGSIVSEIGRSLHKATFMVADTDMRAFKKRSGIKYFLFGQELTHGLGTGVNPELGRAAAEQEKEKIKGFFADQDIVIFIASLGGGLGSGATQVFAEAARDFGGITVGIFTLPFKFEGKNKYNIASKALRNLRQSLNVSITIPNEKIFKIIQADTPITEAFSIVNKNLIESLESLIDLIYNPGIINIDFADLKAILSGKGNMAFLNTAEASGKDKAAKVAEKILHNPLYQPPGPNTFTAEKILFNISGGKNLNMFEIDSISRSISALNPKAKIIFGISKNPGYANKIKTTLLMTGPGVGSKIAAEPQKAPVAAATPVLVKKPKAKKRAVSRKNPPLPVRQKPSRVGVKKRPVIGKSKKGKEKLPQTSTPMPVFERVPVSSALEQAGLKKLTIIETPVKLKKTIRRSALDIKKAEEADQLKQSLQEKEWEIPAFLRLKK